MSDDLQRALQPYIERGEVPAIVAAIALPGGPATIIALGTERDAIVRISSMTKPIVAAAAMRLLETERLRIDEPVARWLPELATPRVLRRPDSELDDTEPARRAITVRDVLTYTAGIGMSADFRPTPLTREEQRLELRTFGPPIPATPLDTDAWMARVATLPFLAHPGERWLYNTCGSLLGVLVARVFQQPLTVALQELVLAPLRMFDTGFFVPPSQLERLLPQFASDGDGTHHEIDDATAASQFARPPAFPNGADGLVSTIDDLLAFHRMLATRGEGLLTAASVELMTTDHVTPVQRAGMDMFLDGRSFGFGIGVPPADRRHTALRVGWDGGLGTTGAADLRTGLVGIALTQVMATAPTSANLFQDFWAVADSHLHADRRGSTGAAGS